MKKILSMILTLVMLVSVFPGIGAAAASTEETSVYTDVPAGAYYEKHLLDLTKMGVVIPAADGKFDPNVPCTRAEFVTYLWRVAGSTADVAPTTFTDVAADADYAKAVAWAQQTGVTTGYEDGTFGVNKTVTRAQMVTFMHRFARYMNYPNVDVTTDISTFADVATLPSHAKASVPWAVAIGMMTGTKENTIDPNRLASRAHAIAFIGRLLDSVAVEEPPVVPAPPVSPNPPAEPNAPAEPDAPDVPEIPDAPEIPEEPEFDNSELGEDDTPIG